MTFKPRIRRSGVPFGAATARIARAEPGAPTLLRLFCGRWCGHESWLFHCGNASLGRVRTAPLSIRIIAERGADTSLGPARRSRLDPVMRIITRGGNTSLDSRGIDGGQTSMSTATAMGSVAATAFRCRCRRRTTEAILKVIDTFVDLRFPLTE